MKLTEIRTTASEGRFLLRFEDGTKLHASMQIIADFSLSPDKVLSDEEYAQLQKAVGAYGAKERAVRIISATNISKKSLTRRLKQKGEDCEDAISAVQWLEDLGLLSDMKTGEMLVRGALNKGYGEYRIRQILREKEIPQELWEQLLSGLPPMDEAVDRLLRQKIKNSNPDAKELQKAVDALRRYGHNWQDIRAGLDRFQVSINLEDTECL